MSRCRELAVKLACFVQDVDEKLLYDTFSAFGVIVTNPKVRLPSCICGGGGVSIICSFPYRLSFMLWPCHFSGMN